MESGLHPNSQIPVKEINRHPLNPEYKASNRAFIQQSILIENIIQQLKFFRILSELYLNRRNCFELRFDLIAAIYNLEP